MLSAARLCSRLCGVVLVELEVELPAPGLWGADENVLHKVRGADENVLHKVTLWGAAASQGSRAVAGPPGGPVVRARWGCRWSAEGKGRGRSRERGERGVGRLLEEPCRAKQLETGCPCRPQCEHACWYRQPRREQPALLKLMHVCVPVTARGAAGLDGSDEKSTGVLDGVSGGAVKPQTSPGQEGWPQPRHVGAIWCWGRRWIVRTITSCRVMFGEMSNGKVA